MIRKASLAFVAVLGAVFALAAGRPDTFTVTRHVEIRASPARIQPLVANFHHWSSWSPWEKLDPHMKRRFSGPESGKGAVYEWDGNDQVGAGRMEIIDISEPHRVEIRLQFIRPFESRNQASFLFDERGDRTRVTWHMSGPMSFTSKVMSLFVSMDSMIGPDFEKGLARMKAIAES